MNPKISASIGLSSRDANGKLGENLRLLTIAEPGVQGTKLKIQEALLRQFISTKTSANVE